MQKLIYYRDISLRLSLINLFRHIMRHRSGVVVSHFYEYLRASSNGHFARRQA